MAQWVNFREIRSKVGIADVLGHYGLLAKAKQKGDELRMHCPFHEDKTPSLTANAKKNGFKCFGCGVHGNVFAFVKLKEGIDTGNNNADDRAAAIMIAEWFGIESSRPGKARAEPGNNTTAEDAADKEPVGEGSDEIEASEPAEEAAGELVNPPLEFAFKNLDHEHAYLADRGLAPVTVEHFGVGYHGGKGIMHGRVVIPIHNEAGELVAYAGRWPGAPPDEEPKYKLPANFHKSLELFNLHRALKAGGTTVIVTEGFFDVMKIHQAGFPNVVGLMGWSLSEEQERQLVQHFDNVVILFDEDEAGRKGREEAIARLASQVFVKVVGMREEGMQPDMLSEEDIQRLLA